MSKKQVLTESDKLRSLRDMGIEVESIDKGKNVYLIHNRRYKTYGLWDIHGDQWVHGYDDGFEETDIDLLSDDEPLIIRKYQKPNGHGAKFYTLYDINTNNNNETITEIQILNHMDYAKLKHSFEKKEDTDEMYQEDMEPINEGKEILKDVFNKYMGNFISEQLVSVNKPFPKVTPKSLEPWQKFVNVVFSHLYEIKGNPQYAEQITRQILKDCNDFLNKKEIK
jgi:hypothetical protein